MHMQAISRHGMVGDGTWVAELAVEPSTTLEPTHFPAKPKQKKKKAKKPKLWVALYDYTAADSTEVSFVEGDTLFNVMASDPGWLVATVARTGATGMLPGNYVEKTARA
jgi:hypothetical protein